MVVLASLAAACTAGPDQPAAEGRLLVIGGDGSVVTLSKTGADRVELRPPAPENLAVLQPTWGPDGGRVVWTELDTNSLQASIAVWDGEAVTPVPAPLSPFYYAWSPDGRLVAFLGNAASGAGLRLGMLDVSAGEAREVDAGQPYYLDWDPDSTRLVTHIGGETLGLLAVDGTTSPISVTPGLFQAPDWTSGGEVVLVGRSEGGGVSAAGPGRLAALRQEVGDRLLVLDPDQGVSRQLADVSGVVSFGASPDGSRVAYTTTGEGFALGRLRAISVDGGEPLEVAADRVAAFQWAPDGGTLWFLTIDVEAQLLVPHVWDGERTLDFPGFLPTQVFASQYLQFWDQFTRSLTLWAPDSSAFAYAAVSEGSVSGTIMVQPVAPGTGPSKVAYGEFVSWSPG